MPKPDALRYSAQGFEKQTIPQYWRPSPPLSTPGPAALPYSVRKPEKKPTVSRCQRPGPPLSATRDRRSPRHSPPPSALQTAALRAPARRSPRLTRHSPQGWEKQTIPRYRRPSPQLSTPGPATLHSQDRHSPLIGAETREKANGTLVLAPWPDALRATARRSTCPGPPLSAPRDRHSPRHSPPLSGPGPPLSAAPRMARSRNRLQ
ncbi:uncharacterized protein LOC134376126 [Cynocephalus volans]|uniref:uncharacterized protein LOC134376126 n=1 Tax=Cynocephalus volans TaxID=110931 RepID=UPI002FCBAB91